MESPTKYIVTIEKKFNDEIETKSGIKFYLDTTYNLEQHVNISGKVVSVPRRKPTSFLGEEFYDTVKVGDKLYFNYITLLDENNLIEHEGEEYWLVEPEMAFATVRGKKIYAVGSHVLIKPIVEEVKSTLIIPEYLKKKELNRGKVVASNDPEMPNKSIVEFDEVGKFVNNIEGNDLFVMYNSNIYFVWTSRS